MLQQATFICVASPSDSIAAHAGVVQRQNTSFPSSERGFDSRRPLSAKQSTSPTPSSAAGGPSGYCR